MYSRGKPIWRMIQEPDPPRLWGPNERMLLVMSGGDVAAIHLGEIEHQFEHNVLLRWLFPETIPEDMHKALWNQSEMRLGNAEGSEPNITAIGVGTKITGRHFTGIIEDDLIDETCAESVVEVPRRVAWHQYAFPLLEVPERDWIDTVGNRWGRIDLNGWIREHEPDCRLGPDRRAILDDGNSLWPERFPADELARLRIKLGPYKFACQYMNDPRDSESAAFASSWIRYYEENVDAEGRPVFVLDNGEMVRQDECFVYMVVDPAATPGNRNDRTAIVVTAVDGSGRIFVRLALALRKDPFECLMDVWKQYERFRPAQINIEAVSFSRLLQKPLEWYGRSKGAYLPVVPIKGSTSVGAKEARINQVVGETFASGRAFLLRNQTDFVDEYTWFPDKTSPRDLLDAYALSQEVWIFRGGKPKKREGADDWYRAAIKAGMNPLTGY